MKTINITKHAVLIKVSISQYSGRMKDQITSQEVANNHRAQADRVATYLDVLDKEAKDKVRKIGDKARGFLNLSGNVWDSEGWRIVRAERLTTIKATLDDYKVEFDEAVRDILGRYDELVEGAREGLGDQLFERIQFPTREDMAKKYAMKIEVRPIVNVQHVALEAVDPKVVDEIRLEVEREDRKRADAAGMECLRKLEQVLANAFQRLSVYGQEIEGEDGKKGKRKASFKDSLIGNVREMVEAIPGINILGDEKVYELSRKMSQTLAQADPSQLRGDAGARSKAVDQAKDLLLEVEGMIQSEGGKPVINLGEQLKRSAERKGKLDEAKAKAEAPKVNTQPDGDLRSKVSAFDL